MTDSTSGAHGLTDLTDRLLDQLEQRIIGQRQACERLLATYLGGGHALLEGAPGIGKTQLARSFAAVLGQDFRRIQFTPDLMPTDVIGNNVYSQETSSFRLIRGPIFTQILMADEINRTPPKTQSALLEAMQERQVTIDGERYQLDPGFFVVATQNPVEYEGTYRLPEAQLDRFATRIEMFHPEPDHELELYRRSVAGTLPSWTEEKRPVDCLSEEESHLLREASGRVHVEDELLEYVVRLVGRVRGSENVELAVSPRAALSLLATARGAAVLRGRDYVVPDDLKQFIEPCWAHRVILTAEAELEGADPAGILRDIANSVEVPR